MGHMSETHRRVLLAKPRGYCAGVDRAVQAVEIALGKFGAPVNDEVQPACAHMAEERRKDIVVIAQEFECWIRKIGTGGAASGFIVIRSPMAVDHWSFGFSPPV